MSVNISKNQLKEKVKQSFGWPTINLEVEESHLNFAVDRAVSLFNRHAYGEGVTNDWVLLSATCGASAYDVPTNVTSVIETQLGSDYLAGNTAELFTFENMMWNVGALNVWNWGNFGLVTYHLAQQNLDLIRQMIPSMYSFRYNRLENKMYVNPTPSASTTLWLKTYSTVAASATYDSNWIYDWSRAETMEILGRIRSKYSTLPGPGGNIQLDGSSLVQQAITDKDRLMKELIGGYSEPLNSFIG